MLKVYVVYFIWEMLIYNTFDFIWCLLYLYNSYYCRLQTNFSDTMHCCMLYAVVIFFFTECWQQVLSFSYADDIISTCCSSVIQNSDCLWSLCCRLCLKNTNFTVSTLQSKLCWLYMLKVFVHFVTDRSTGGSSSF